ncbi:hypothetical protein RIR_jg9821.t1 [Rhizophagus irregularis DAOM 181602=DAOM 197198]|nr:hypothetical protein RIR_jg9821.t1 [Rhizophagus irregularis DAOM 181602=DAOM 197198]
MFPLNTISTTSAKELVAFYKSSIKSSYSCPSKKIKQRANLFMDWDIPHYNDDYIEKKILIKESAVTTIRNRKCVLVQ